MASRNSAAISLAAKNVSTTRRPYCYKPSLILASKTWTAAMPPRPVRLIRLSRGRRVRRCRPITRLSGLASPFLVGKRRRAAKPTRASPMRKAWPSFAARRMRVCQTSFSYDIRRPCEAAEMDVPRAEIAIPRIRRSLSRGLWKRFSNPYTASTRTTKTQLR